MQTCIWPSWCYCHSLSLASVKSRLVLPFWYRLTRVVPEKGPLNGCVCMCNSTKLWYIKHPFTKLLHAELARSLKENFLGHLFSFCKPDAISVIQPASSIGMNKLYMVWQTRHLHFTRKIVISLQQYDLSPQNGGWLICLSVWETCSALSSDIAIFWFSRWHLGNLKFLNPCTSETCSTSTY